MGLVLFFYRIIRKMRNFFPTIGTEKVFIYIIYLMIMELPFNSHILDIIASNRIPFLTSIFLFFTFLGDVKGYILIVVFVYWLKDKKLGIQLAYLTVVSAMFNHVLKSIIRNPRPFVTDGTYKEKWAISKADIEETALEYSTPSGHAMSAGTFWSYLMLKMRSRNIAILSVFMIIMIGLSRPYLGVHYFEDIILGWILGILLSYLVFRYEDKIEHFWNKLSIYMKILPLLIISIATFIIIGVIAGWSSHDGQTVATNTGILMGIIIGSILEKQQINFSTDYNTKLQALIRYIVGVIIVFVTLIGFDILFGLIAIDASFVGYLLRFIRYLLVGISVTYFAPIIFIRLKLMHK